MSFLPQWLEVRTQEELDRALTRQGTVPICIGSGSFNVEGAAWVIADDLARVELSEGFLQAGGAATICAEGNARVEAHDRAIVDAKGKATVWARDHVNVTASDHSRVAVWGRGASFIPSVRAAGSATVEAKGSATVEAFGEATVLAYGQVHVNVHLRATVCAWDEATVRAEGNTRVYAWGRARVDAFGPVRVEAWEAASVRARGSEVDARGAATVELRGRATARSTSQVTVLRRGAGGQEVEQLPSDGGPPTEALEWCSFHGVAVAADDVILYKAVDDSFRAACGTAYIPGSIPEAVNQHDEWTLASDGHHVCAHPSLALEFAPQATRFVACPAKIRDLCVDLAKSHSANIRVERISAPVLEVDLEAAPINVRDEDAVG